MTQDPISRTNYAIANEGKESTQMLPPRLPCLKYSELLVEGESPQGGTPTLLDGRLCVKPEFAREYEVTAEQKMSYIRNWVSTIGQCTTLQAGELANGKLILTTGQQQITTIFEFVSDGFAVNLDGLGIAPRGQHYFSGLAEWLRSDLLNQYVLLRIIPQATMEDCKGYYLMGPQGSMDLEPAGTVEWDEGEFRKRAEGRQLLDARNARLAAEG